jgi:hypothetical protein
VFDQHQKKYLSRVQRPLLARVSNALQTSSIDKSGTGRCDCCMTDPNANNGGGLPAYALAVRAASGMIRTQLNLEISTAHAWFHGIRKSLV